jgi:hypothetical protein
LSKSRSKWRIVAAVGAGLAASAAMFRWFPRRADPDDAERRRRSHVNQVGRIVDGQIVEIIEVVPPPPQENAAPKKSLRARTVNGGHRRLVGYSYSISGVSYETAQDVTGLEERAALHRLAAGQAASVKYDPSNPSNSILISDDWSGLH